MFWQTAVVIGRILGETGSPPPEVSDPAMILLKRQNVVVGCTPGDGGMTGDAAIDALIDAPIDAPADASVDAGPSDGGVGDGGLDDAGTPDASTCTMIPGDAVTMIVQPHVWTTVDSRHFAVLLVTPQRPIVELQSPDVFTNLASLTAPKIEEHTIEIPDESKGTVCRDGCASSSNNEGCGGGYEEDTWWDPPILGDGGLGDGGLVEEMIGPYQFVRGQPSEAAELARWLETLGYDYAQDDLDAVAPYIALGYHVVAIRVALDRPLRGPMLPVALTWPGSELRVPASLGHGAVQPGTFTVYIAAKDAYELPGANVRFAKQTVSSGVNLYLTRNEIALNQNLPPSDDPIATLRYAGDFQEVTIVEHEVHVPVEVFCERGGCCRDCSAKPRSRVDLVSILIAVAFVLRRRRPRRLRR